jgi:MATE family multidrug resistance protein
MMNFKLLQWFKIKDHSLGESYGSILKYFYPECVTALILYSLPYFVDSYFIGSLKSTSLYAISGIVDNFLTLLIKAAEGFSIGIVVIAGCHNGSKLYKKAGQTFVESFWSIVFIGGAISGVIYFSVFQIYSWFNFPPDLVEQGVLYFKLKAIALFFMFIFFSVIGFFRAIKNTVVPMVLFGMGSCIFMLSDYILIFGKYGSPTFGLNGSAIAYCIQYAMLSLLAMAYILIAQENKKYEIKLFSRFINWQTMWVLLKTSAPIVVDKVVMAGAYVWLAQLLSPLGTNVMASFSLIKLMERFAFIPAIGFAQVITFLVSNDVGRGAWKDVHVNIKRVIHISTIMVGITLLAGSLYPGWFISFVDQKDEFGYLVAQIFPSLSVLVFLDLLQLILSGALRGAGAVQVVMWNRIWVIGGFFMPVSYAISLIPMTSVALKFFLIYGSFFLGNGLMSIFYIKWLMQGKIKEVKCG